MKEQNVHVVVDYDLNNIDILNKDRRVLIAYVMAIGNYALVGHMFC